MVKSGPIARKEDVGTFAKRTLFVALLLSSVCFPMSAVANNIGINDGTELRTSLLAGTTVIELNASEGADLGFSIPNPGQEFIMKQKEHYSSWLSAINVDLNFMGEVAFQNAHYVQEGGLKIITDIPFEDLIATTNGNIYAAPLDSITDFEGGAIYNDADLSFTGKSIHFANNMIDSATVWAPQNLSDMRSRGGAVYNKENLTVAPDTVASFSKNAIIAGTTSGEGFANSFAQGGAVYNEGVANFKGSVSFSDNYVGQKWAHTLLYPGDGSTQDAWSLSDGGAFYNANKAVFEKSAIFDNNIAAYGTASRGGAVFNAGTDYANNSSLTVTVPTLLFKGETIFRNNTVVSDDLYAYGGGVANMKGEITFDGNTTFQSNNAILTSPTLGEVVAGAGLYTLGNNSLVTFNGETNFISNQIATVSDQSSGNGAGVYLSDGRVVFNGKTTFKNNTITASNGYSYGEGAALQALGATATVSFNDNATFEGNKVLASTYAVGGAITNYATVTFDGDSTIVFKNNEVKNLIAEDQYTNEELQQHNVHFIQGRGGALYNAEGNITFGARTKVYFEGNKALSEQATAFGGAIYNELFANDIGRVNFNGEVYFKNNEAKTGGGAIFNKGIMALNGTTVFEGNKAPLGGAVYNDKGAELSISGESVAFRNNQADLGANIYNLGTVKIENVKDTMDIDYAPYTTAAYPESSHTLFDKTGDIYNKGAIKITHSDLQLFGGINTKQKNKDGSVSIENSRVDLGQNTIYADTVDIKKNSKVITHIENGLNGKIEADTVSISNENTSLGVVVGVGEIKKGETKEYQIIKASNSTGDFQNLSENMLYEVKEKKGADGVYQIRKLTDGEAQLKAEEATKNPYCKDGKCTSYSKEASNAWIDNEKIEGNEQASLMQEKLNELAQLHGTNTDDYQDAINSLTPDSSALIASHASEVTRQISNALGQRFYDAMEKSHFVYNGKVHYKAPKETSRVWMHSLYSTSENTGDKSFEMDTVGVIAGVETPIDRNLKVGAAYTYSFADGKGMNRDTEIQTHAGIVYGQYHPGRFYVNGFAMYGQSTVTEERKVLSQKVESEYDVNIAAAEVIAGYKLGPVVVGKWVSGILSPEAGLRYVYTKQKEYTDTLGQTVEAADAHALTGILGARYTVGYSLSPSIQWYPELRAAVTYDFISPTLDNQVVLLNGAGYSLESEEMDKFGIEIGLKIGFEIDKRTEIGLEYEGLFKGDYTNHTGTANVKYNF